MFVVYPLVRAIQLGHLRCDATGKRCRDGGWGQYIDVFRSNEFQHALANTTRLALMTVPIGLALGIGLAVLADKQLRGIGVFRTVFSLDGRHQRCRCQPGVVRAAAARGRSRSPTSSTASSRR